MPVFLTSLFARVAGKVSGGLFGFLNKRGERQTNLDVAGVEGMKHSKKDEITLATFYIPIWMFLLGAILVVTGFEHRGRILIDTAKETIVFLDTTLRLDSLYGYVLLMIVLVSLGLSRVASGYRAAKNGRRNAPSGQGNTGDNSADVFKETK